MTRFRLPYPLLALTLLALASWAGCAGSGTTTPAEETGSLLAAADDTRAVEVAAEIGALELDADTTALEPLMAGRPLEQRAFRDSRGDCRTVEGNPRDGGTMTFDGCPTPRGSLSGTITWSGLQPGATDTETTSTTTRDLTYTPVDRDLPIHLTGTGTLTVTIFEDLQTLHRSGMSVATEGERRLETESDLTWSRARNVRTSPYPVGTTASRFYRGSTLVREVLLTFDGTNIATGTINGREFTINLDRPSDRPVRRR